LIILFLAALIGVSLGLLGGGGSILAVPMLTYVAGLETKAAIAMSLLVVGTTALFATIPHARRGLVEWRTGGIFAVTAMIGAYGGGFAAQWFSGTVLLLLFAGMMVLTSLAMFRGRGELQSGTRESLPVGLVVVEGLAVGALTGLVGAGGGFLVVPALVLLGGMEIHKAVGTSLLVIALKSFAAYAGHAGHVDVDLELAGLVTISAVLGSFVGGALGTKVPAHALRRLFAGFVLVMAGYVIWREAGLVASLSVVGTATFILLWWRWMASRSGEAVAPTGTENSKSEQKDHRFASAGTIP
jgi:hypothetical protein